MSKAHQIDSQKCPCVFSRAVKLITVGMALYGAYSAGKWVKENHIELREKWRAAQHTQGESVEAEDFAD